MRDYWLSKFFYDVQSAAPEYRADRAAFMDRYPLKPEHRAAVLADDVAFLARFVNPYLLRFYFGAAGMKDDEFIRRLKAGAAAEAQHG
ncbi:MAG: hypothetical protein KIT16_04395 [Rhodospirillaceae bacterium]|nr:hypothetical protein [Rhodospirillaceae bacterium]